MTPPDADQPPLSPEVEKLKKQLLGDRKSKAFIPLAEEYVKAGLLHEAALVLEDGLKEFPAFITALVALGRVCIQLDDTPRATEVLQEAVKISPDNVLAHRMLARLYVKEQAWEAAKRSCDMALFSYPKDEEMLALKTEIAPHVGGGTPAPPPLPTRKTTPPRKPDAAPPPAQAEAAPARGPSAAAALFGAAAEPPPTMNTAATVKPVRRSDSKPATVSPTAPSPGARPAARTKASQLQNLLARIKARRNS